MTLWLTVCAVLLVGPCSGEPRRRDRSPWARQLRHEEFTPANDRLSSGHLSQNARYAEYDYVKYRGDDGNDSPLVIKDYTGIEERDYNPAKPQCHPQTITKFRTIFKDKKANVFNKVEIRNPRPQVHKTKETRHTTIRYPVFITQVIKPLLTQVETKVKPMFFTKTLKRIKTIVFTVTGIGQVTITSVKYEKEYVTRCQKREYGGGHHVGGQKGHGAGHAGSYHRREDYDQPEYVDPDYVSSPAYATDRLDTYDDIYTYRQPSSSRYKRNVDLSPSISEIEPDKYISVITNPLPSFS